MTRALAVGPPGALCDAVLAALGSLGIATHHDGGDADPVALLRDAEARLGGPVGLLLSWLSPGAGRGMVDLQPADWDAALAAGPRRAAFLLQAFAAALPPATGDASGETRAPGAALLLIDHPLHFATPDDAATAVAADAMAALTRIAAVQLAPTCRVNALAPATKPAKIRGGARETDLSPSETRLPRDPSTLARSIVHTLDMPAMTGQILSLQAHTDLADRGADDSS